MKTNTTNQNYSKTALFPPIDKKIQKTSSKPLSSTKSPDSLLNLLKQI